MDRGSSIGNLLGVPSADHDLMGQKVEVKYQRLWRSPNASKHTFKYSELDASVNGWRAEARPDLRIADKVIHDPSVKLTTVSIVQDLW